LLLALASAAILGSKSRGTHDIFYSLKFETPQPGGPGPHIYIPQEQGDPVITPGTGFHFRRLLRLAGLRWRCSTSPNRLLKYLMQHGPHRKRRIQHFLYCCVCIRCCGNVFSGLLLSKSRGRTHRRQGDLISLLLFFHEKVSWIGRRHVQKNP
jgi:hypothetical protein